MKIDLKEIITRYDLNEKDLAGTLFPYVAEPLRSLKRVMTGVSQLNAEQVLQLSKVAGCTLDDLYSKWSIRKEKGNHCWTLRKGKYKAILNIEEQRTQLFSDDSLLIDQVITSTAVSLSNYMKQIEELIKDLECPGSKLKNKEQ